MAMAFPICGIISCPVRTGREVSRQNRCEFWKSDIDYVDKARYSHCPFPIELVMSNLMWEWSDGSEGKV